MVPRKRVHQIPSTVSAQCVNLMNQGHAESMTTVRDVDLAKDPRLFFVQVLDVKTIFAVYGRM